MDETLVAHSLRGEGFDASEDGTGRGTPLVPIDLRQASRGEKITNNRSKGSGGAPGHGIGELGDPAFTVSERGQAIAFSCKDHGADAGLIAPTLRSIGHNGSHANAGGQLAVATGWAVRRLTPTECERLQGFPDDYTNVPWRGKNGAPDGPRYKALGNSMAVNVMRWLGWRIQMVDGLASEAAA